MQYVIVAVVVVLALAAVVVPLVRGPRGAAVGDLDPLPRAREEEHPGAGTPAGEPQTAGFPPERELRPPPPGPRTTPERTVPSPEAPQPPGEADAEELPVAAPPPPGPARPLGQPAGTGRGAIMRSPSLHARTTSPEEEAVVRYREALRAGTVCPACSAANPPGSKFCMECGEKLGAAQ